MKKEILRNYVRKALIPLCFAILPLTLFSFKPIDAHEHMMGQKQTYKVNEPLVDNLIYVNNHGLPYETEEQVAALPCAVVRVATKVWQKSCKEAAKYAAYWAVDMLLGYYDAMEVREMEQIGIISRL